MGAPGGIHPLGVVWRREGKYLERFFVFRRQLDKAVTFGKCSQVFSVDVENVKVAVGFKEAFIAAIEELHITEIKAADVQHSWIYGQSQYVMIGFFIAMKNS